MAKICTAKACAKTTGLCIHEKWLVGIAAVALAAVIGWSLA